MIEGSHRITAPIDAALQLPHTGLVTVPSTVTPGREAASRQAHNLQIVGSNPTLATNSLLQLRLA
jgi:hypothetical protein